MILNIDYRFNNVYNTDTTAIELLTEAYRNVIFRFTNVGVKEVDDSATVRFSYEILSPAKFKEEYLRQDEYFNRHLGLVLNSLILDVAEINDETRENDSKEYTEE